MILLNEVAKAGPYLIVYRDSSDPSLFYYIPRFAEVAQRDDGTLIFGQRLFKRPSHDGFSVYNFTVRSVMPQKEYVAVKQELQAMVGRPVSIVPIPGFDLRGEAITDLSFAMTGGRVQQQGGNLLTDLAVSMTFQEWCEPDMAKLFMSKAGWTGVIKYKLTGLLTPFKARGRVNWYRMQEHFKSQVSVKHWFVSANLSYEVQRLIENGTVDVVIEGGTPEQKDKVYALAKQVADRLFVPSIAPNPLPDHPQGGIFGLSVNYSKVEENKEQVYTFEERATETRDLGMAIVAGNIPASYFSGIDGKPFTYSLNEPFDIQATEQLRRFMVEKIRKEKDGGEA